MLILAGSSYGDRLQLTSSYFAIVCDGPNLLVRAEGVHEELDLHDFFIISHADSDEGVLGDRVNLREAAERNVQLIA